MLIPREIAYFIKIVEEGNLSKAADSLCISQPALSKYLSKLENNIGSQLVLRNGPFITLTEEGRIYYDASVQMYSIMNQAKERIDDIESSRPKTLIIGTTGDRSQRKMGDFIAPLLRDDPFLHLKIVEESAGELKRKIKQSEIDIGFMSPSEPDPDLEEILLFSTDVQLALYKDHPLVRKAEAGEKIAIDDIAGERFALPGKHTNFRRKIDVFLEAHGIIPDVTIETKSKYSAVTYVETGTAIGFYPKNYAWQSDEIVFADLLETFRYSQAITYKKCAYLPAAAKKFIQLATSYYKSNVNNL